MSIASNKISLRAPLNILQFDAQVSEADEKVFQLPRGRLEKALEPFHPRAHMGKLCTLEPAVWRARYGEKLQKFISLAHTHDPDGPYGFSPDAEPFDLAVGEWARTLAPGREAPRCLQRCAFFARAGRRRS